MEWNNEKAKIIVKNIQKETLESGRHIRIGRKDGCIVDRRLVDGKLVDTVVKKAEEVQKGLDEMFADHHPDNSDHIEEIDHYIKDNWKNA